MLRLTESSPSDRFTKLLVDEETLLVSSSRKLSCITIVASFLFLKKIRDIRYDSEGEKKLFAASTEQKFLFCFDQVFRY